MAAGPLPAGPGAGAECERGQAELCGHANDSALRLQLVVGYLPTATKSALPAWRKGDCTYFSYFYFIFFPPPPGPRPINEECCFGRAMSAYCGSDPSL